MGKQCKAIKYVVSDNIRHLLIDKEMSQLALAERCQMSISTLAKKMAGVTDWKLSDLDIIAKGLKVNITDLIER